MFSFLQGKMLTVIGSVALCALIWGGLATKLYVSSQEELASVKQKYTQLEQDYKEALNQNDKLVKDNEKESEVLVELSNRMSELEQQKDQAISKLSKFRCVKPKVQQTEEVDNEEVDVNAPFSIEFRDALRLPAPNS